MQIVVSILTCSGILIILALALNLINILQAGRRMPDGRSMAQILGVDPESATFDDVEKLSRKDKMQLFYAAEIPNMDSLRAHSKIISHFHKTIHPA